MMSLALEDIMKLLTKEIEKALPPLYSTEEVPCEQKKIIVRFFTPDSNWTWLAVEANAVLADGSEVPMTDPRAAERVDVLFFGLVGFAKEWGNFVLSELQSARGPLGFGIERDMHFRNKTVADLR